MQDLYAERDEITELLMQELDTCRKSGIKYAENEAEYRKALRLAILELRADGLPVTITPDVARGIPGIADMKMARDSSEAVYKSSQEFINVLKIRLRMVNDEIARAWSNGGMQ